MKIYILKSPAFLRPVLRKLFGVKKEKQQKTA